MLVDCPTCKVTSGNWCRTYKYKTAKEPHTKRLDVLIIAGNMANSLYVDYREQLISICNVELHYMI